MRDARNLVKLKTSSEWCDYFRYNEQSLIDIPWALGVDLSETERRAIASSLQEFQLGESSEGRHMITASTRYAEETGDADYVKAVRLFIGEEHRHAVDLGRAMDLAGIERVGKTWVDSAFRWLRRGVGLEQSIVVVISAELIAMIYYAALRDATNSRVLHRICEQILQDEVEHIRFQCERLAMIRQHSSRWQVAMSHALHRAFFGVTCLVVWRRHRRALRAGGFGFLAFWRGARHEMHKAVRLMDPRNTTLAVESASSADVNVEKRQSAEAA